MIRKMTGKNQSYLTLILKDLTNNTLRPNLTLAAVFLQPYNVAPHALLF